MSEQMPLGEWIEVKRLSYGLNDMGYMLVKPVFIGSELVVYHRQDGTEIGGSVSDEWRYPIDERKRLEEKILYEWRSQGLDYCYDGWLDIPEDWLLQWMLDHGVSVE